MRVSLLFTLLFLLVDVDHIDLNIQENEAAFIFFDLPDGEAALIEDGQENVLINTGSKASRSALFKRLKVYGVKKIDKLVVTNSAVPYSGNVSEVMDRYNVGSLLTTEAISEVIEQDNDISKEKIKILKRGDEGEWLKGVHATVLTLSDSNVRAMTIKFQYGKHSLLYMGWTDPEMEKSLEKDPRVDCNIVKIGNFAIDGSIPSFLHKVDPQVAIIFHRKGHLPDKELLDELDTVWIDVYRTHQIGTVTIKMTPEMYQITTIPIDESDT